jgi:hypothetical protein
LVLRYESMKIVEVVESVKVVLMKTIRPEGTAQAVRASIRNISGVRHTIKCPAEGEINVR